MNEEYNGKIYLITSTPCPICPMAREVMEDIKEDEDVDVPVEEIKVNEELEKARELSGNHSTVPLWVYNENYSRSIDRHEPKKYVLKDLNLD